MSISHSQASVASSHGADKTVFPVHKVEHASSMSNEEVHESPATVPFQEQLMWPKYREYCQDFISEFFGTCIMILFGDGVVAQVVLSKGEKGDYQSISWGWG